MTTGEEVYVLDDGEPDAQIGSWKYILEHRIGTVRAIVRAPEKYGPGEDMIAVEFPDAFIGGHDCNKSCARHQGQYFTAKNLRPAYVRTVPNIRSVGV
jgi:hypothetical protein